MQPPDQLSCLNIVVDPPDTLEWSPNDQLADRLLGRFGTLDVTAMRPGKATILFEHEHRICSGSATVIVPSETYTGTATIIQTSTTRNRPNCSPRKSWRRTVDEDNVELVLTTGSILTPGRVAGRFQLVQRGPRTIIRSGFPVVCNVDDGIVTVESDGGDRPSGTAPFVGEVTNSDGEVHVEARVRGENGWLRLSGQVSVTRVSPTPNAANVVRVRFRWDHRLENPSWYFRDVARGGTHWADHFLEEETGTIDFERQYSSTFPSRVP